MVCAASITLTLILLLLLPLADDDIDLHGRAEWGGSEVEKCGNGVLDVELHEQCDDGNIVSGDGCTGTESHDSRSQCQLEKPECPELHSSLTGWLHITDKIYCLSDPTSNSGCQQVKCEVRGNVSQSS